MVVELSAQVSVPEGDFPQASAASGLGPRWLPVVLGQGVTLSTLQMLRNGGVRLVRLLNCANLPPPHSKVTNRAGAGLRPEPTSKPLVQLRPTTLTPSVPGGPEGSSPVAATWGEGVPGSQTQARSWSAEPNFPAPTVWPGISAPCKVLVRCPRTCEKPIQHDVPELQAVKMERLGQLRTVAPILASHVPERTWGALTIFSWGPRFIKLAKATCAVG